MCLAGDLCSRSEPSHNGNASSDGILPSDLIEGSRSIPDAICQHFQGTHRWPEEETERKEAKDDNTVIFPELPIDLPCAPVLYILQEWGRCERTCMLGRRGAHNNHANCAAHNHSAVWLLNVCVCWGESRSHCSVLVHFVVVFVHLFCAQERFELMGIS